MGRKLINHGVLVSRKGRRAVVLTDKGDFRSVRLKRAVDLSVGQTVLAKHLTTASHFVRRMILTPLMAIGFSVLCFVPMSHSTYAPPGPVAAYVYFDLRASIEASLDRNMQVISVQPLNAEGKQLLKETRFARNMTFQELSAALFSKLKQKKLLKDQSLCVVSTVLTGQISHDYRSVYEQKLTAAFNSKVQDVLQNHRIGIEWLHGSVDGKKAAEARGLSVGKYLLYLRANVFGQTISPEDARLLSADQLMKAAESVSEPWQPLIRSDSGPRIRDMQMQGDQDRTVPDNVLPFPRLLPDGKGSTYRFPGSKVLRYA